MQLLALDPGTITGFAVGDTDVCVPVTPLEAMARPPPKPISGAEQIGREGADIATFALAYDVWLKYTIHYHGIEGLIFEAPWIGPKTHQHTARKLMGMAYHTDLVGKQLELSWVKEARPDAVRVHFIGRGRVKRAEKKRRTVAECRLRGWEVESDDEADALALFDYAAACLATIAGREAA